MAIDARTALEEIRKLYFASAPATIQRDFERAIDLLKGLLTLMEQATAKAAP